MHKNLPKFYHFIDNLNIKNILKFDKKIALIYKNYKKKPSEKDILNFKIFCKKKKIKFLISNYFDIFKKYALDGFYIPSFNKKKFNCKINYKDPIVIGSAHTIKEIRIKEKQGVKLIFLSPLFKSKKSNKFLGICRYNILTNLTKIPSIALGGIRYNNVQYLKMIKSYGFASIEFFKNKNIKVK